MWITSNVQYGTENHNILYGQFGLVDVAQGTLPYVDFRECQISFLFLPNKISFVVNPYVRTYL